MARGWTAAASLVLLFIHTPSWAVDVFVEVALNGRRTGQIVHFDQQAQELMADAADLAGLGLSISETARKIIPLSSLAGVRFVFHTETQSVEIFAEESALKRTIIGPLTDLPAPDRAGYGALFNYGLAIGTATGAAAHIAGDLDLRLFGPQGVLASRWYGGSGPARYSWIRRLDTAFIHDEPAALRSWTLGDFISASLPWSRPVRAGGFSLATNFAVRPDLVTRPMPWLRGSISVPSTIDLYIDGVRALSSPAPPGPFEVTQAPLVNGQGEVLLRVIDALGRQSLQAFSFYATDKLLKQGLTAYALEAGWLRKDYGQPGDRYAKGFGHALMRWGVNDMVTLEARASVAGDVAEVGGGAVLKLGEVAVAALSVNESNFGGGRQWRASLERQTRRYSFFAAWQESYGDYRDSAAVAGDVPIARSIQAGVSWNSETLGAFGLNYFEQKYQRHPLRADFGDVGVLAANWSRSIADGWTLYGSAYRTVHGGGGSGFMLGLSVSLLDNVVMTGGVTASDGRVGAYAGATRSPPTEGGWGWNLQGQTVAENAQASARYISPIGEIGAGTSFAPDSLAGTIYGLGSIAWLINDRPRFGRQTSQSFVAVDTGEPDIGITLENRFAGRSGADGRLFIPDIIPFVPTHIAIDARNVPLDQEIVTGTREVRAPRSAGLLLSLPVRRAHTAAVQFVTSDGKTIPLGAAVTVNGKPQGPIGYDGIAWLTDLSDENHIEIATRPYPCTAELPFAAVSSGLASSAVVCATAPSVR